MAGSDKDKDVALSRLAKLREGRRVLKRARIPGTDTDCLLRVLSCSEVQECQAAAYVRFRELGIPVDVISLALFEDEVLVQILYRACRDPEDPDRLAFCADAADLRDHTTVDERAALFALYRDFCAEQDPDPGELTAELIQEIDEHIKKKDESRLRSYGSPVLVTYLLTTASRLVS